MKFKLVNEQYNISESGLSRIWQYTKNHVSFAVIGSQDKDTKENRFPELVKEVNALMHKDRKITFKKLIGRYTYDDKTVGEEESLLINNISLEQALALGRSVNQESIIYKDSDFFGFIDCATGEPDGKFSSDDRNMSFNKEDIELFGSRLNSKHNKGQGFLFKMESVYPVQKSSVRKLGDLTTETEELFEMRYNF